MVAEIGNSAFARLQKEEELTPAALQHGYKEAWTDWDVNEARELSLSLVQSSDLWKEPGLKDVKQARLQAPSTFLAGQGNTCQRPLCL